MSLMQNTVLRRLRPKPVQILAVDNDRDSSNLYTALFEYDGVKVKTTESVKEALDLLEQFVPDVLVCEFRFLGESVYPLIQKVRDIAQNRHRNIPVFVISTFPAAHLAKTLLVQVDAYQTKPVELDRVTQEIRNLLLLSQTAHPKMQSYLPKLNSDKRFYCFC